jgi:hypothetical protein
MVDRFSSSLKLVEDRMNGRSDGHSDYTKLRLQSYTLILCHYRYDQRFERWSGMIHLVGGIVSERREPGPGTVKILSEMWDSQMNRIQRHHAPFLGLESIPTG